MKKRILALLLAMAMVLTLVPAAFAAEETVAEETQTAEAAPAQTAAEPAQTAEPAEPAAEPATTEEETAQPAEQDAPAAPAEETAFEAEAPLADTARNGDPNCYCGGWHNGEYGHVCEALTWTDVTFENQTTWWTGAANNVNVNLRLTEDFTNADGVDHRIKKSFYVGKSEQQAGAPQENLGRVINLDLNGHTLVVSGGRVCNIYCGCTFNICDSSEAHTGKIICQTANGTSSTFAFWNGPTVENPSTLNLWGGTFTNTSTACKVPACTLDTSNSYVNIYSGATLTGFHNNLATSDSNVIANNPGSVSNAKTRAGVFALTGSNSTVNLRGGQITDCSTTAQGGAIVVYSASNKVNLEAGSITNCTSGFNGGAIYLASGTVTMQPGFVIDNCKVSLGTEDAEKIRANCFGGGIYKGSGTLEISGGTISNCSAGKGGGLYIRNGATTISGLTISGNRVEGIFESKNSAPTTNPNSYGGGLFYEPTNTTSTLDVSDSYITNNYSSAGGGGARIQSVGTTFTNVTMTGNVCNFSDGAAIYLPGTLTLKDCTITDNHTNCTTGGAIYNNSGISTRSSSSSTPKLTLTGKNKIYGNTSNRDGVECNIGFNATNASYPAEVTINDLTEDGYFTLQVPGDTAKLVFDDSNITDATTKHANDSEIAYFGPAYLVDSGLNDAQLTLDFHGRTSYSTTDLLEFDVYAQIDSESLVEEAYIHSFISEITMEGTGAVSFTDVDGNVGYNSDDGTISLFMWDDQTTLAPLLMTKQPMKIGTIYGTPTTEGNVTITCDVEVSSGATSTPLALQAKQDITISSGVVHDHCYCGGTFGGVGDHVCDTEAHTWTAINSSNVDNYFNNTLVGSDGEELYLYLNGDVTVSDALLVGAATTDGNSEAAVTIHLCLNGHTAIFTGGVMFRLVSGKLTICDCAGTGKVILDEKTSGGSIQVARLAFTPKTSCDDATLEVYGGTYDLTDNAPATTYGQFFYMARNSFLNIYGGTFDAHNKVSTYSYGAGHIYMTAGHGLNIYGGTFRNGVSTGASIASGSIYVTNTPTVLQGATFCNNKATVEANNTATGAVYVNVGSVNSDMTASISGLKFENNVATSPVSTDAANNLALASGTITIDDTDYGVIRVGSPKVELPGTTKIDRLYAIGSNITFLDVEPGTVLSAEGANTFTDTDAGKIILGGNSTANAVRCVDGTLVAITAQPSTIAFNAASYTKEYDAQPYAFSDSDVIVTGSTGAVSFQYYSDAACETKISAPNAIGEYYVKAIVASDADHNAATSEAVTVTITEATTSHTHCICGGNYTVGDHTEHDETIVWQPLGQANRSAFQKAFTDGENHYFYLTGDLTTTANTAIGHKTNGAGYVFLDLNGHQLISTGNRQFDMRQGSITICDCQGTGKVVAAPDSSVITTNNGMPSAGTIGFWQQSAYGLPGSEFTAYGVTFENAEGLTNTSSHGFIYATLEANINLYGCTFDGKECVNVPYPSSPTNHGAGLLTVEGKSNLTIVDCTFCNGRAVAYGGAIAVRGNSTLTLTDTKFSNNEAPSGGNNVIVNGSTANVNTQMKDFLFTGASTITGDIAAESELKLNVTNALLNIGDGTVGAGTVIDLNGATVKFNGTKIVDLAIKSSENDNGKLVFSEDMDESTVKGIVTAIASNCMKADAAERCLPLLSGDRTYTVCKLDAEGGFFCPPIKATLTENTYRFRMQPRFASQTAYDILAEAGSPDVITIGFTISATNNGEPVEISDSLNEQASTALNCNFTLDNVNEYFSNMKDSVVFYVDVAGLTTGYVVTVVPYIMVNGTIAYTATGATETSVLTLS